MDIDHPTEQFETRLFDLLKQIRTTIQNERREVTAVMDGLTVLMSPQALTDFKKDAETCLMMTTQYPMVLDPAHVDEAILKRSSKFLAAQVAGALAQYNKYAVPHKLTFLFNAQFVGMVQIAWVHHVELLTDESTTDVQPATHS